MAHANPIFKKIFLQIYNRIDVFMYNFFYKLQPTIINNMYTQNLNVHKYNTIQKHHLHVLYQQEAVIFTQKVFVALIY